MELSKLGVLVTQLAELLVVLEEARIGRGRPSTPDLLQCVRDLVVSIAAKLINDLGRHEQRELSLLKQGRELSQFLKIVFREVVEGQVDVGVNEQQHVLT